MYKLTSNGVSRISDGMVIPLDKGNMDYLTYLAWCEEGNTAEPYQTDAEVSAGFRAAIAAKRFVQESAGMTFMGMFIDTGRDSQGLINGAAVSAILDPDYVCRWKTPEGFVSLDAETLKTVAKAVRDHVQACFDREEALLLLVDKGTFKDYLLEKGWPSYEPVSDNAED